MNQYKATYSNKQENKQYSLKKIILIWALSAVPMGVLAFVITPNVVAITNWNPLIVYWIAVIIGLFWQFILSVAILKSDGYAINRQTIMVRMNYKKPTNPKTGTASYWLLLWTLPFIALSFLLQSGFIPLPDIDSLMNPVMKHFPKYDLSSLATSDYKGAWWILVLFIVTSILNYFLGEEFIYRGILLPKMNGVFGKMDWFFNGVLFGLYHLHKPQVLLSTAVYFGLIFALPSKIFQSSWMAVIIHGLEGLLGIILIIGIILGKS